MTFILVDILVTEGLNKYVLISNSLKSRSLVPKVIYLVKYSVQTCRAGSHCMYFLIINRDYS